MKGEADRRAQDNEVKENQQVEQGAASGAAPAAPPAAAAAAAAPAAVPAEASGGSGGNARTRQPFTQLSQMESDLALARALQEQERAYMILSNANYYDYQGGDAAGVAESGDEEDVEVADEEEDQEEEESDEAEEPLGLEAQLESDEALARALQEDEMRESTARMMALAGIHDYEDGEYDEVYDEGDEQYDDDDDSSEEEMWEDVDPDNMSYEELIALGEVVGTESRGMAATSIAELPVTTYRKSSSHSDSSSDCEQCVICRLEYEENESLLTLPCKHNYHAECIRQWLQINKVCPVCSAEVGGGSSS